MSNTVDNKVVSMEFDNKQFEAGIKETITSLDNLKQALQFNTQVTGINTLQQHFNSFSLSNIESAVESLSNRFSMMGIVGMNVISNLTNKAMGFASKIEQMTLGQITTGGKARAQKVADARFKLEGLLKDADKVEQAFTSASAAVEGTSFGLDAAVSTASQLASSNVQLGEEMDTALRGVAGLAAMTNSSFEEMGHIFTKVAGNGRLMGIELTQISSHGVNAAAALATSLNTTEAEVRSMVSKGQIDFQTFAKAMNEAFGDQAAKANETLTGALSNVKSALSRIGEIFYSGIIENKEFIEMVNQLRLAINRVKKEIEPLKEPFKTLVSSVSKLGASVLKFFGYSSEAKTFIETIGDGMNSLSGWIDAFTAHVDAMYEALGLEEVVKTAKTAEKVLRSITEEEKQAASDIWVYGTYGNGIVREQMLAAAGLNYDNVQDLVNLIVANNGDLEAAVEQYKNTVVEAAEETKEATKETKEEVEETSTAFVPGQKALERIVELFKMVKQGIASVKKVANALGKSIKKVFSWEDVSKDFGNFIKIVAELGTAIEVNDERAEKLEGIFSGLLSVIDLIRQAFWFVASVLSAVLSPILTVIIDAFLWLGDKVGRAITKFNEFIKKGDYLNRILTKIRDVISKVVDWLSLFFEKFTQLPAVQKITDALGDFVDKIKDGILVYVDKAVGALDDLFGVADDADTDTMTKVLGDVNGVLENMIDFASDAKGMLEKVYEKFSLIADPIASAAQAMTDFKTKTAKAKLISGDLLESDGVVGVTSTLAGYFDSFSSGVNKFVKSIIDTLSAIDFAKVVLVGFGAAVTAMISSISYFFFTISNVAVAAETMLYSVSGAFKALSKRIYDPMNGKAKVIRAVALALIALAAALYLVSKIPADRLWDSVFALSTIIILIAAFTSALIIMTKSLTAVESTNLVRLIAQIGATMLALSGAILVLAVALNILALIPTDGVLISLGIITLLLLEMTALSLVMAKYAPLLAKGGLSIIFLAGSVYILVLSLHKLADLELEGILNKLGILALCIVTIGLIAALASNAGVGTAVSILGVVASIWLIEIALMDIMAYGVSLEEIKQHLSQFIPVVIVLIGIGAYMAILGAVGAKTVGVTGTIMASMIAMLAVTLAIRVLAKTIDDYGGGKFAAAALTLLGFFIIFGALIFEISSLYVKNPNAGKVLMRMAAAISILALVTWLLGSVKDVEVIKRGAKAVAYLTVFAAGLMWMSQFTEKANYKSILAMIGMVASLAMIIALLSLVTDKVALWESVGILGSALLALGVSMYLVCIQAKKINEKKLLLMVLMVATVALALIAIMQYSKDCKAAIVASIALSMAMLSIGATMAIINKTWPSNLSKRRIAELAIMIGMVAVVGASLMGIAALGKNWTNIMLAALGMSAVLATIGATMAIINKTWPSSMSANRLAALAIMIGMVAVIGASLMGISALGKDWTSIMVAALGMSAVLATFGATMAIINKTWPASMTANRLAALAISIGLVAVIGAAIMGIAALGKDWKSILVASLGLSATLITFAGALAILGTIHILPSDAASYLVAATALIPLAASIAILALFDWPKLLGAVGAMSLTLLAFTAVIAILAALNYYVIPGGVTIILASLVPALLAMAAAMLSVSLVIPALIKGLEGLTKINYEKIKIGTLFALTGVVATLGVATVIFSAGLLVLSVALAVVAVALTLLAAPAGIMLLEVYLIIKAVTNLADQLNKFGNTLKNIASSIKTLANVIKHDFGQMLKNIIASFISALVLLASSQPIINNSISTIAAGIVELLIDIIDKIITVVVSGVIRISEKLAEKAPIIAKNVLSIIASILKAIYSYAGTFSKYGIMIVYAFVEGIMTGLEIMVPKVLETIVSLVLTVLEAVSTVLYSNQDRITDAIRAIIDVIALTIFNVLNELFGGLLEEMGWYSQMEKDLAENVQKVAAKQGQIAAETTADSYNDTLNDEKSEISNTTSSVFGEAVDGSEDILTRKSNMLGGATSNGLVDGIKSKVGEVKEGFQSLITDATNGVDTSKATEGLSEKIVNEGLTAGDSVYSVQKETLSKHAKGITDAQVQAFLDEGWQQDPTNPDLLVRYIRTSYKITSSDVTDAILNNGQLNDEAEESGESVSDSFGLGLSNFDIEGTYGTDLYDKYSSLTHDDMYGAAMDGISAASPSKDAMKVSEYFMQGLVNGVKDNMTMVSEAFNGVGATMTESTKAELESFGELLGSEKEWQPTIKPIVDTSNIETAKQLVDDTFDTTSFKMAANANVSVGNSTQSALAYQVAMLTEQVEKLANKDYSKVLEGVNINVDASTTVDGTKLRQTSANYTIKTIDDKQRAYIMSRGGRA